MDEAIERAEHEAARCAAEQTGLGVPTEYIGFAQAYLLADDVADGAEVFSLLRVHAADPRSYLDMFFATGAERERIDEADRASPDR
jgi:hypothetical protein